MLRQNLIYINMRCAGAKKGGPAGFSLPLEATGRPVSLNLCFFAGCA